MAEEYPLSLDMSVRSLPDADGDEMTAFRMRRSSTGQKMMTVESLGHRQPGHQILSQPDLLTPVTSAINRATRAVYYSFYRLILRFSHDKVVRAGPLLWRKYISPGDPNPGMSFDILHGILPFYYTPYLTCYLAFSVAFHLTLILSFEYTRSDIWHVILSKTVFSVLSGMFSISFWHFIWDSTFFF